MFPLLQNKSSLSLNLTSLQEFRQRCRRPIRTSLWIKDRNESNTAYRPPRAPAAGSPAANTHRRVRPGAGPFIYPVGSPCGGDRAARSPGSENVTWRAPGSGLCSQSSSLPFSSLKGRHSHKGIRFLAPAVRLQLSLEGHHCGPALPRASGTGARRRRSPKAKRGNQHRARSLVPRQGAEPGTAPRAPRSHARGQRGTAPAALPPVVRAPPGPRPEPAPLSSRCTRSGARARLASLPPQLPHGGHRPPRVPGREAVGPQSEECARPGSLPRDAEGAHSPPRPHTRPGCPPSWC